jgi:hypothetical protein
MKKIIFIIFWGLLILDIAGCGGAQGLRSKFIREKKKEDQRPTVILALEDDEAITDYHELYKKHFLLWQYWHGGLIDAIEDNFKKQQQSALRTVEHLSYLQKYILEEKRAFIIDYIERVDDIRLKMSDRRLSDIQRSRIVKELKKIKRLVEKEYRYPKIKDYIIVSSDK